MSDTLRGVALLLSLALWSPAVPPFLAGETSPEQAGLLYAGALAMSLLGCWLMASLLRAYAPDAPESAAAPGADPDPPAPDGSADDAPAAADGEARRAEDALR